MIDQLFGQFEAAHPESISFKKLFRNEILVSKGNRETHLYFVLDGALRVVHETEKTGQIIRFGYTDSIITSLPAFFDESPSWFDIIAIRKSEVKCFEKIALQDFIDSSEINLKNYQLILQELVRQQGEREIDLLTSSPQERYKRVLDRSPSLFQEIPAVHIANYLRMTPEHLSRIRKS